MFLPASATVEASLVIPLYIYAVLAVAYVIQIIGIKSTMYKAMYNSTRQLAAYAYAVERTERFSGAAAKKAVTSALAKQYLLSSLPGEYISQNRISRGQSGIRVYAGFSEQFNNEISIKGDANTIQGGAGQDNIKINGDNNIANGGAESDSFMVSNGNNNTIDGEGGERNTLIDNGKNTVYTNAVDITPRPFELNIKVDIGSGSDKYISTSISFNLFDFSVDFSTAEGALESLESIDEMLSSVSDQLLNIGNTINRLESVSEAQSIKLNNLISFRSTMRDADIAEESSNYIRYQILQQASATLLASSRNLKAQNVIGLLGSINS